MAFLGSSVINLRCTAVKGVQRILDWGEARPHQSATPVRGGLISRRQGWGLGEGMCRFFLFYRKLSDKTDFSGKELKDFL